MSTNHGSLSLIQLSHEADNETRANYSISQPFPTNHSLEHPASPDLLQGQFFDTYFSLPRFAVETTLATSAMILNLATLVTMQVGQITIQVGHRVGRSGHHTSRSSHHQHVGRSGQHIGRSGHHVGRSGHHVCRSGPHIRRSSGIVHNLY